MGTHKIQSSIYDYIRMKMTMWKKSSAIDDLTLDINQGDFCGYSWSSTAPEVYLYQTGRNGILLPDRRHCLDFRHEYSGRCSYLGYPKDCRHGIPEPGQSRSFGNILEEDVGFGPENLGVPIDEIWRRVDQAPGGSRHDCVPFKITKQTVRRSEAARALLPVVMAKCPAVHHSDEPTAMLGSERPQRGG